MNKQTTSAILSFIIGVVVALIFLLSFKTCNDKKAAEHTYIYDSDTVWREHYRIDTIPGKVVPPKTVTEYLRGKAIHDTLEILSPYGVPEYIIDTFYPPIFDKQIAGAIYGKISKDSLRLDFMDSTQEIVTKEYPMNFNNFRYTFFDGNLKAIPIPNKEGIGAPVKKALHTESNLYFTYTPTSKNFRTMTDYSIMYKRFGIYGYGQIQTLQSPRFDYGVGLKIKLR